MLTSLSEGQNFTNYKLIKFHCTNSYMAHVLANPPVDGKMQACRYLAAILPPSCRDAAMPPPTGPHHQVPHPPPTLRVAYTHPLTPSPLFAPHQHPACVPPCPRRR